MSLIILNVVAAFMLLGMAYRGPAAQRAYALARKDPKNFTGGILLVACEPELLKMTDEQRKWLEANNWKVVFTGVGKVLSAVKTTATLLRYPNAKAVVNVGTCGSQTLPKGALVIPDMAAQRDMDATLIMRAFVPDFPKHLTPFTEEIFRKIDLSNFVLPTGVRAIVGGKVGTGDNTHAHLEESDFLWDCVEMELAAILAAFAEVGHRAKFLAFKWVSDTADENAGEDWHENADGIPLGDIIKLLAANF